MEKMREHKRKLGGEGEVKQQVYRNKGIHKTSAVGIEFSKGKGDYHGTRGEEEGLVRVPN